MLTCKIPTNHKNFENTVSADGDEVDVKGAKVVVFKRTWQKPTI